MITKYKSHKSKINIVNNNIFSKTKLTINLNLTNHSNKTNNNINTN